MAIAHIYISVACVCRYHDNHERPAVWHADSPLHRAGTAEHYHRRTAEKEIRQKAGQRACLHNGNTADRILRGRNGICDGNTIIP